MLYFLGHDRLNIGDYIFQCACLQVYVPLLFGPGWDGLAEVVSILCLAAIPAVIWSAAASWLRAEGRPQGELVATLAMTVALIANTIVMAPHGLTALAMGYLVVAVLTQIGAALMPLSIALHRTNLQEA